MKKHHLFFVAFLFFVKITFAQKHNYKISLESNFFIIEPIDTINPNDISFYLESDDNNEFELKAAPVVLGKCLYEDFLTNQEKFIAYFQNKVYEAGFLDSSVIYEVDQFNGLQSKVIFYYYQTNVWGSIPIRCSYESGIFNLVIYSNHIAVLSLPIQIKDNKIILINN